MESGSMKASEKKIGSENAEIEIGSLEDSHAHAIKFVSLRFGGTGWERKVISEKSNVVQYSTKPGSRTAYVCLLTHSEEGVLETKTYTFKHDHSVLVIGDVVHFLEIEKY